MTEEATNLVLEHLRALRADMTAVKAEMTAMKTEQRTDSRTLSILLQEARLLRAAVNDSPRRT